MGQLIRFELSKILKKRIVYITMAAFCVIFGIMLYSWIFGNEWAKDQEGRNLYGMEAAAYNDEIIKRFEGPLIDEKVLAILEAFPRTGDTDIYDISNSIYYPVAQLFAERDGSWNGKTVAEVFPEFTEPPMLGRASDWESFLYSMTYIVLMAGIVLIIVISPIFSDEYTSGMDALILTSKNGPRRCVTAKIMASFVFAFGYAVMILTLSFLMFYIGNGFEGWDTDIQLGELTIYSGVSQPVKCYEAAILLAVSSLCSILTLNGLVLAFSVISRTSFVSIIASAVVYIAPMFINPGEDTARRLILMMPVNCINTSGVLKTGGFEVRGMEIPPACFLGLLLILVSVCSVLFCRQSFKRHQVI